MVDCRRFNEDVNCGFAVETCTSALLKKSTSKKSDICCYGKCCEAFKKLLSFIFCCFIKERTIHNLENSECRNVVLVVFNVFKNFQGVVSALKGINNNV